MLAGIGVERGQLDVSAPITRYLPELDNAAWRGTTVRHLLDMTAAAQYSEDYADPRTDFWKESAVVGWRPALVDDRTPPSLLDYARSLDGQDVQNGSMFHYRTVCTNVLGMVLERAMGDRLATPLETEIWCRLATEHDATIVVDRAHLPFAGAGMSATAREPPKFGLMMIGDGRLGGRQIVPAAWIADTVTGDSTSRECFAKGEYGQVMPGWHYRNQVWVASSEPAVMLAIGRPPLAPEGPCSGQLPVGSDSKRGLLPEQRAQHPGGLLVDGEPLHEQVRGRLVIGGLDHRQQGAGGPGDGLVPFHQDAHHLHRLRRLRRRVGQRGQLAEFRVRARRRVTEGADSLGDRVHGVPQFGVLGHEHVVQAVEHRARDVPVEIVGRQVQRVSVGEQPAQACCDRGAILLADADVDARCRGTAALR
jgi:hypothetical protein